MPDLVDSDEGFNNDPASRATDCFAKKNPVFRRGLGTFIPDVVGQTGTGCSMIPVGTSANITEDR